MIRWGPANRNAVVCGGHSCTLLLACRSRRAVVSIYGGSTLTYTVKPKYSLKQSRNFHRSYHVYQRNIHATEKRFARKLPYFTGNTVEKQQDADATSLQKDGLEIQRNDIRRSFRQIAIQPKQTITTEANAANAIAQADRKINGDTQDEGREKAGTPDFPNQSLARGSHENKFFDVHEDLGTYETKETNYVIRLNEDRASDLARSPRSRVSNGIEAHQSWAGATANGPRDEHIEHEYLSNGEIIATEQFEISESEDEVALSQSQLDEYEPDYSKHFGVEDQRHLSSCDTTQLHAHLEYHASRGHVDHVDSIISLLVYGKHERPDDRHYNAMILVNADNESGNTERVKAVLQDMEQASVPLSTHLCHSILRVLAVHPDALLRDQVLAEMRQHWHTLSAEGWHDLICGLLREGNLERALDELDEMQESGVSAKTWLKDMITYALCDEGELDYALLFLQNRLSDEGNKISLAVWYYVFDVACENLHVDAIRFVWKNCVQKDHLAPSSGQCLHVLNTAARLADYSLASDVFRVMSERGTHLQELHYELLIKTYLDVEDLESVLRIVCIMAEGGVCLKETSLLPLQKFLRSKRDRPRQAFSILQNFASRNRRSPISLANCLLEATLVLDGFSKAQEVHRAMPKFCSSRANTETFNILLRGCSSDKNTATQLIRQLSVVGERPNALTYDRIILICCRSGDYEEAFDYFLDMKDHYGWTARSGTLEEMTKHFMKVSDTRRLGVLLEGMKEMNSPLHQCLRREALEMGLIEDGKKLRVEHSMAVA